MEDAGSVPAMPYFNKGKLLLRLFLGYGEGGSGPHRFNT
jgi:hypothetical protein